MWNLRARPNGGVQLGRHRALPAEANTMCAYACVRVCACAWTQGLRTQYPERNARTVQLPTAPCVPPGQGTADLRPRFSAEVCHRRLASTRAGGDWQWRRLAGDPISQNLGIPMPPRPGLTVSDDDGAAAPRAGGGRGR